MRPRRGFLQHLPWALALFLPLVAVAVLGFRELERQSARVSDAVQQQALSFLRSARLHFEEQLRSRTQTVLREVSIAAPNLIGVARRLLDEQERVLDLFTVDASGHIAHPRLPDARESVRPFAGMPGHEDLRLAEALELLEDAADAPEAARRIYDEFLRGAGPQDRDRARASFRMAGILRRQGRLAAAESAYVSASLTGVGQPAATSIELICRLAIAEMYGRRDDLLELARGIADNEWHRVSDDLLAAAFARLGAALPSNTPGLAEITATEKVRRNSRRFAAEFETFLAAGLQRPLAEAAAGAEQLILRTIGNGAECALVALRPLSADEQRHARNARWLGVRIDLPALVNEIMDPYLTPGRDGYHVALLDPEGQPILAAPTATDAAPAVTTLAGLLLRAVPVDPEASLREGRAAIRNQVLILLALLGVALVGGIWLVRSVAREAELSALQMEFVSRVSHELKTPLALIKMYGETLALGRSKDAAQVAEFGGIVAREADRLTTQIERVLTFAQDQRGSLRYTPRSIELGDLAAAVVDEYREHVERSGCQLTTNLDDPAAGGLLAEVDPSAFHDALVGLIENAVKYTPADAPDKTIHVALYAEPDGVAVIDVCDRGIGVPAREARRIFEPFYRASNAGEVRGSGLGLSLVQHFAQAHGGEIRVTPRPGGGSVFRLRLPRAATDSTAPPT